MFYEISSLSHSVYILFFLVLCFASCLLSIDCVGGFGSFHLKRMSRLANNEEKAMTRCRFAGGLDSSEHGVIPKMAVADDG